VTSRRPHNHSKMVHAQKTLDELTVLVSEKLTKLDAGAVRFSIRSLPYEEPNWRIRTARLRPNEQAVVTAVSFELRSRYDLQMEERSTPWQSTVSTCGQIRYIDGYPHNLRRLASASWLKVLFLRA
jgi:hypothetical protein